MSYLVRKISRSKWADCDMSTDQVVTADAVTNCLKTTKNTLSVWFAAREEDIATAKLALLAALERFDSVDLVVLRLDDVLDENLELIESDGLTAAKSLVTLHRDIATLSLVELEKVAKLVQRKIVEKKTERVMKNNFQQIIKSAVADGIIKKDDLPQKMVDQL